MHKLLFDEFYLPPDLRSATIADKYRYFSKNGKDYMLLFNVEVFGPFPESNVPWDISDAQKIAIYNPEVTKVLTWIKTNIIRKLGQIDYKTLDVLVRIATGMLNKCSTVPKEIKIMFHDNMAWNLRTAYYDIMASELPF